MIFFARYEASQYGSPYIESEHLLLGLAREDELLLGLVLPKAQSPCQQIRDEIEPEIERRERIPTSVAVPLTHECRRILEFAKEEANRLGHKHIATGHLLLGILGEGGCAAARLLVKHGAVLENLRPKIAAHSSDRTSHIGPSTIAYEYAPHSRSQAPLATAIDAFLMAWAARDAKAIAGLFMAHGQLWDIHGELWLSVSQVEKGLVAHFSVIAPSEVSPDVRDIKMVTANAAVVTLVWEPKGEAKSHKAAARRMVLVFCEADPQWQIASAHLASVPPGASASAQ